MNIELTENEIQQIKERVLEEKYQELKKKADSFVEMSMSNGHFVGEIRGLIASEIARDLKERVLAKVYDEKLIDEAIVRAENTIKSTLENRLKSGITVRFEND